MIHQKGLRQEIILFTRYPEPGTTKTRLIPELGPEGAASLQRTMTETLVRKVLQLKADDHFQLAVYFTNGTHEKMQQWLGPHLSVYEQEGVDLGERMMHAFGESRKRGANRTVLIGSDCPDLDGGLINEALDALNSCQLVLGPSSDGGYYLIGSSNDMPLDSLSRLLSGMNWGCPEVLRTTVARARDVGVKISFLKELHDIDLPSDLTYFHHHSHPQ